MSPTKDPIIDLFTSAQLKRLEREHTALGKQIEKIESRRSALMTIIEAAKSLKPQDDPPAPPFGARKKRRAVTKRRGDRRARGGRTQTAASVSPAAASTSAPTEQQRQGRRETSEWKVMVREITLTSEHPVSYREARQEILKTHLAKQLQQSDKGFFYAISKLSKSGEIVSYKGHLFSPQLFAQFKSQLDAGLIRDLKIENAAHFSPMGEAVKQFMRGRPTGATSGNMIWELKKTPEFAEVIERNKTHPYNVFATLVRKKDLVKKGNCYFSAEFSTEIKNETPSADGPEGVSKSVGEGDTSPVESQSPKGLFG